MILGEQERQTGKEDSPAMAYLAFQSLKDLLNELGLQPSQEKNFPLSTNMVCLGKEVDSETLTLSMAQTPVQDLLTELEHWSSRDVYTI